MAQTSNDGWAQANGDGVTDVFWTDFRSWDAAFIEVYVAPDASSAGVLQTLGVHYTVSGDLMAPGGSPVTFTPGNIPAAGTVVTLRRNLTIARQTSFAASPTLLRSALDNEFDYLNDLAADLVRESLAALQLAPTDARQGMTLPPIVGNTVVGFDAAKAPVLLAAATGLALPVPDETALVHKTGDVTAGARMDVDGVTSGQVVVITVPDGDTVLIAAPAGVRFVDRGNGVLGLEFNGSPAKLEVQEIVQA